jgi:hypothetical protein
VGEIIKKCSEVKWGEVRWGEVKGSKLWRGCEGYVSVVKWNEGKVMMKHECIRSWHYVFHYCYCLVYSVLIFINISLYNCSYNCICCSCNCIHCVCYVLYCLCSFLYCVLFQRDVLFCIVCVLCMLCLTVVPPSLVKNQFAVKINK